MQCHTHRLSPGGLLPSSQRPSFPLPPPGCGRGFTRRALLHQGARSSSRDGRTPSSSRARKRPCGNVQATVGGISPVSVYESVVALSKAGVASKGLTAAVAASFKLFVLCGTVGWLLQIKQLPEDTAAVLSKVAFTLLIPCMLFTKCGATLSQRPDLSLLCVPLVATSQVAVGAALGWVAGQVADSSLWRSPRGEWDPRKRRAGARAVSQWAAGALGVPQAAWALQPGLKPGLVEIVKTCCAFGNTITLPLVFLASLLPTAAYERAVGYCALFLLGWSPLLWSLGGKMLQGAAHPAAPVAKEEDQRPSRSPFLREKPADRTASVQKVLDGGTLTEEEHTAKSRRATNIYRLKTFCVTALQAVNPPLLGVLGGLLIGFSPLGALIFWPQGERALAAAARMPVELKLGVGCLRTAVETLSLLGSATLAVQGVVLGASIFQKQQTQQSQGQKEGERGLRDSPSLLPSSPRGLQGFPRGPARAEKEEGVLALLIPQSPEEWRSLLAVGVVRLLLLPAINTVAVLYMRARGWLPSDPVCALLLLTQGVMPSAQNLVLLTNVSPDLRYLSPRLARLLLRLYLVATLPIAAWMTLFAKLLPLPTA